jgi:hypothetical protein
MDLQKEFDIQLTTCYMSNMKISTFIVTIHHIKKTRILTIQNSMKFTMSLQTLAHEIINLVLITN